MARFINHHADGNLTLQMVYTPGVRGCRADNQRLYRIALFANRDIPPMVGGGRLRRLNSAAPVRLKGATAFQILERSELRFGVSKRALSFIIIIFLKQFNSQHYATEELCYSYGPNYWVRQPHKNAGLSVPDARHDIHIFARLEASTDA